MFETIVRLTDEHEALLRATTDADGKADIRGINGALFGLSDMQWSMLHQARAALFLYDQLVAEAKAASDA